MHCAPDATFAAQAGALADVQTLEQYTEWMKDILSVLTDGTYELHAFAEDRERQQVCAFATFVGTHKAGGPSPPNREDHTHRLRLRYAVWRWQDRAHDQGLE